MADLISRTAAIEEATDWKIKPDDEIFAAIKIAIRSKIEQLPAVDAVAVVHGRWGENGDCSECGFQPWYERDIHTLSYCPNCGAKMDGDQEART